MRVDLHLHTSRSDGSLEPRDLVRAARAGGLDVIAITDHDAVAGVLEAQDAAPPGLAVVAGIEVSCTHAGAEVHVLGYFVDPRNTKLLAYTSEAEESRRRRVRAMLERLEALGVGVSYDDVLAAAGGRALMLGRPHVARALVAAGHVSSYSEAFDRFLGDGRPACLPTDLISVAEAIELVHGAGGVAVWAHPDPTLFDLEIRRFVAWGLDGVECYRPNAMPTERMLLETAARDLRLLRSGGSDWHGAWNGPLGGFSVSAADVGPLLARGGFSTA